MSKKDGWIFLLVEVLCIVNAIVAFKVFENAFTSAIIASSGFVVGVGFIFKITRSYKAKKRVLSYWFSMANLFLSCLPLFIIRLMTPSDERIGAIAGVSAVKFHQFSEWLFIILILATVIDLVRAFRTQKA